MISAVSEDSFLVTLSDTVSEDLPARLGSLCDCIEGQNWPWLTDLVPSYTTLLVVYDPLQVDFRQVEAALKTVVSKAPTAGNETTDSHRREVIRIPVYYSPESGPDLESLAAACELSVDEVIRRHTAETYQVYAIGLPRDLALWARLTRQSPIPARKPREAMYRQAALVLPTGKRRSIRWRHPGDGN